MSDFPSHRTDRWHRFIPRMSVRTLMISVLVLGGGFGWVAHLARIQREAISAIRKAGGSIIYDWQYDGAELRVVKGTNISINEVPGWPRWLVDRLGVDWFGNVRLGRGGERPGQLAPEVIHDALVHIGRLRRLRQLVLIMTPVDDDDMACLSGLSDLEGLMIRGRNRSEVTDRGVLHLKGLTGLKGLYLEDSQITDAGVACLEGLTRLESLNLARTRVGDPGLAHLKNLPRLKSLVLDGTRVTDAGLVPLLRGRTDYEALYLNDTQVGDATLEAIRGMERLEWLHLRCTRVTDAGMAFVTGLKSLRSLDLFRANVGDVGVGHLSRLTRLEFLNLDGTRVGDGGLGSLSGLKNLKELRLMETQVSVEPKGLKASLPNTRIDAVGKNWR